MVFHPTQRRWWPVSTGIPILPYRLFDIDRITSRSVSNALLAALLAAVYAGVVFALTRFLPAEGNLAVAGSTLAVAALFNPVRRRLQSAVDRRFNRARYDAERLVEALAGRLGSMSELNEIVADLLKVVGQSVHPASAGVWVRPGR